MRPLSRMKYRSTQDWKGSPNGAIVIAFSKGDEVEADVIGDDLTDVALKEGWIEPADRRFNGVQGYIDAGLQQEKSVNSVLKRAIASIDVEDASLWTSKSGPTTEALESILGVSVSAAERNEAWKQLQAE